MSRGLITPAERLLEAFVDPDGSFRQFRQWWILPRDDFGRVVCGRSVMSTLRSPTSRSVVCLTRSFCRPWNTTAANLCSIITSLYLYIDSFLQVPSYLSSPLLP